MVSSSDDNGVNAVNVPSHVAIILDGNGRWAEWCDLHRFEGHKAGAENIPPIVEAAMGAGVDYLTLFCFSSENWRRSDEEVKALWDLLDYYLSEESVRLLESNVRLRVIGERSSLSPSNIAAIERAEQLTSECDGLTLFIALNYGGRWDICEAARGIAAACLRGDLLVDDIDEDIFAGYLSSADIPEPDLLIRSGGELRLSNFLLWQLAYTEFIFSDKAWPAFSNVDFAECLSEYSGRIRRFGKSSV